MKLSLSTSYVFLALNMLASLFRADFFNITVCTLAIYILSAPSGQSPRNLRLLILGLAISLAQDAVWHAMQDYAAEDGSDGGGAQHTLRTFAWVINFIMIGFKFGLAFVYWKASLLEKLANEMDREALSVDYGAPLG